MRDCVVLLGAETPGGRRIAKKLRAEHFQCLLMSSGATAGEVQGLDVSGVVVVSEEAEGGHRPDPALLGLDIPLLAIGDAASALLDTVASRQPGEAADRVLPIRFMDSPLFGGMISAERWVSKAYAYAVTPPYRILAESEGLALAVGDEDRHQYFVQYQIERNDPDGTAMLAAFAGKVCGCMPWWTPEAILRDAVEQIREAVGDEEAVCAISGGLDSTVAALLTREALGPRALFVYVDTGLLREGEVQETERFFTKQLGLMLHRIDASGRVLRGLKGLADMDEKRAVIERAIGEAVMDAGAHLNPKPMLVKGTNYMDTLSQSTVQEGDPAWGRTVAPLSELYKDDIRVLGKMLSLPAEMIERQPFPGMGLAARIRGEVTHARLAALRRADEIFVEALAEGGQAKRLDRFFALLDETGGYSTVVLRALQGAEPHMNVARLPYDLLERTVERIQAALPRVERVLYDMTPGLAEWPM